MRHTNKFLLLTLGATCLFGLSSCRFVIDGGGSDVGSLTFGDAKNDYQYLDSSYRKDIDLLGTPLTGKPTPEDTSILTSIQYPNSYVNLETYHEMNNQKFAPSTGNTKLLVVPLIFEASNVYPGYYTKEYREDIQSILNDAFFAEEYTQDGYDSLASYYRKSSYGALNISGEVAEPYYLNCKVDDMLNRSNDVNQIITNYVYNLMNKINNDYKDRISDFDSNNDGKIDGIWFIYNVYDYQTIETMYPNMNIEDPAQTMLWAFTSSIAKDAVIPVFGWASYSFIGKGDELTDTHTMIHETGHILGLDDYYDYDATASNYNSPVGGTDMMDSNILDHNAYSKFQLGWIDPKYVTGEGEITIRPFHSSGDAIIVPSSNGFNGSAFDEYLILSYYQPLGLNQRDAINGYDGIDGLTQRGLQVYYVDSRLGTVHKNNTNYYNRYVDAYDLTLDDVRGDTAYQIIASNTPSYSYAHTLPSNLIEAISSDYQKGFAPYSKGQSLSIIGRIPQYKDSDLFTTGESFMNVDGRSRQEVFHDGNIKYDFAVTKMTEDGITIKFSFVN